MTDSTAELVAQLRRVAETGDGTVSCQVLRQVANTIDRLTRELAVKCARIDEIMESYRRLHTDLAVARNLRVKELTADLACVREENERSRFYISATAYCEKCNSYTECQDTCGYGPDTEERQDMDIARGYLNGTLPIRSVPKWERPSNEK